MNSSCFIFPYKNTASDLKSLKWLIGSHAYLLAVQKQFRGTPQLPLLAFQDSIQLGKHNSQRNVSVVRKREWMLHCWDNKGSLHCLFSFLHTIINSINTRERQLLPSISVSSFIKGEERIRWLQTFFLYFTTQYDVGRHWSYLWKMLLSRKRGLCLTLVLLSPHHPSLSLLYSSL